MVKSSAFQNAELLKSRLTTVPISAEMENTLQEQHENDSNSDIVADGENISPHDSGLSNITCMEDMDKPALAVSESQPLEKTAMRPPAPKSSMLPPPPKKSAPSQNNDKDMGYTKPEWSGSPPVDQFPYYFEVLLFTKLLAQPPYGLKRCRSSRMALLSTLSRSAEKILS